MRKREREREGGGEGKKEGDSKSFLRANLFLARSFHFCKSNLCERGSNFSNSKHASVGIDVMITWRNNDRVHLDVETKGKTHGLSIIHIYSGSCLM